MFYIYSIQYIYSVHTVLSVSDPSAAVGKCKHITSFPEAGFPGLERNKTKTA